MDLIVRDRRSRFTKVETAICLLQRTHSFTLRASIANKNENPLIDAMTVVKITHFSHPLPASLSPDVALFRRHFPSRAHLQQFGGCHLHVMEARKVTSRAG
jgi:hypothetical protein